MKIRTSFVTNSSGSSSSRIMIENEVLCNILKKYTDDINNRLREIDDSQIKIVGISDGIIEDYGSYGDGESKSTFWYMSDNDSLKEIPGAYLDCLDESISVYKSDEIINSIFNELKKELKEKEDLINSLYNKVEYNSSYSGDGGCSEDKKVYDIRNKCPICNSVLVYSLHDSDDMDYNDNSWRRNYSEIFSCSNPKCSYKVDIKNNEEDVGHDSDLPFKQTDSYLNLKLDDKDEEISFDWFDDDDDDLPF